jgi:apoptosis-stimulating of p53 protein 1
LTYCKQDKLGNVNGGEVFAVYDYDDPREDELAFEVGDRLVVLRKGDENESEWWWSRNDGKNVEGYVPRNLVGLFPRVEPMTTTNRQHNETDSNREESVA